MLTEGIGAPMLLSRTMLCESNCAWMASACTQRTCTRQPLPPLSPKVCMPSYTVPSMTRTHTIPMYCTWSGQQGVHAQRCAKQTSFKGGMGYGCVPMHRHEHVDALKPWKDDQACMQARDCRVMETRPILYKHVTGGHASEPKHIRSTPILVCLSLFRKL